MILADCQQAVPANTNVFMETWKEITLKSFFFFEVGTLGLGLGISQFFRASACGHFPHGKGVGYPRAPKG